VLQTEGDDLQEKLDQAKRDAEARAAAGLAWAAALCAASVDASAFRKNSSAADTLLKTS
jgi:hypothetical protein